MSTSIEVITDAVTLRPSPDQMKAWSRTAGEQPLADWIEEVADGAATRLAYDERTWPVVIPLKFPIEWGKDRAPISEITLRRGKIGDIKGMKLSDEVPTEHLIIIASRLSNQPTPVIERLDAEDAGEVMATVLDFYGRCLTAGRKSSR